VAVEVELDGLEVVIRDVGEHAPCGIGVFVV
jgi:hypothetical protein